MNLTQQMDTLRNSPPTIENPLFGSSDDHFKPPSIITPSLPMEKDGEMRPPSLSKNFSFQSMNVLNLKAKKSVAPRKVL